MIYAHRRYLNQSIRKLLSESLVLSRFSYCDVVYGHLLTKSDQSRIQKIQNFCCRFVFSLRKYSHVSNKITELKWLSMANRTKYHFCFYLYKLMKYKIPLALYEKLMTRSSLHTLEVRNKHHLHLPRHRSAVFQRSFTYQAVKFYNCILINYLHLSEHKVKELLRIEFLSH